MASVVVSEGKEKEFFEKIKLTSIKEAEYEFLNSTTASVTAQVFRHWKLSTNLINSIEFVDEISNADPEFVRRTQILDVIRTAANIIEPLSDKSIEKALEKAKKYDLDIQSLVASIEELKSKL